MANQKETATCGEILQLPAEIIHHIQSFLNVREAARTCTLFKSWYDAWCTRPNIDFNQCDFRLRSNGDPKFQITDKSFSEFTKKTMQKYEDLNLKITTFRLQLESQLYPWENIFSHANNELVKELIVKAMNLGAIDLKIYQSNYSFFVLEDEVLGSESLVRLSVTRCEIDLWRNAEVTCSKLKYLYLMQVKVNSIVFHGDFMSKFPCLEELVIRYCKGFKDIRICSRSLEHISLVGNFIETSLFDVPNIRKFHFEDSCLHDIPNIQNFHFETTDHHRRKMEWESDIHIKCYELNDSWFILLNQLLEKFIMSKISLSVLVRLKESDFYTRSSLLNPLPLHVVENLTLSDSGDGSTSLIPTFLDWIFLSCRPKLITVRWAGYGFYDYSKMNYMVELVCKRLVDERISDDSHCIPNKSMAGLQDLEEVNVGVFEARLGVWRDLPWTTLLDASAFTNHKRMQVRFQLRWGLEPSAAKCS
ncbi:hypothetical protein C2S51_026573 [Perilla frutescens var. frutescens]|nr:hypothetical protein C2S51_026573 [Perilla frutescens var. frutescens]